MVFLCSDVLTLSLVSTVSPLTRSAQRMSTDLLPQIVLRTFEKLNQMIPGSPLLPTMGATLRGVPRCDNYQWINISFGFTHIGDIGTLRLSIFPNLKPLRKTSLHVGAYFNGWDLLNPHWEAQTKSRTSKSCSSNLDKSGAFPWRQLRPVKVEIEQSKNSILKWPHVLRNQF